MTEQPMGGNGAPDTEASLGRVVRRSLSWSFLGNLVTRTGTLVLGIVMARLLSPKDFGVFAVAMAALLILIAVNDLGIIPTLVRWPGRLEEVGATAATIAAGASAALYVALFALAPTIASAVGAPQATGVLRLMGVCVVIDGIFAVPNAALTRAFRQDIRAFADVTGFIVTAAVSIALASGGTGAASLAWGRIAGNLAISLIVFAKAPARYRPGFDPIAARALLTQGLPLAVSGFFRFAMLNVDYLVVGSVLGPVALGFYLLAFNVSSWPGNLMTFAIQPVALAGFARLQTDRAALRAAFTRAFLALLVLTVPAVIGLSTLARPLIVMLYGEKWHAAAVVLRWLAILGGIRVLVDLGWDVLVASGRARATLGLQALWFVTLIPALIIGAELDGIRGAGISQVLVAIVVVVPGYAAVLRRCGLLPTGYRSELMRIGVGALAAVGLAFAALQLPSDPARVLGGGLLIVVAYAVVLLPLRTLLRAQRVEFSRSSTSDGVDPQRARELASAQIPGVLGGEGTAPGDDFA